MNHLHFSAGERTNYPVCFLVPTIRRDEIQKYYLDPFPIDSDEVLVLDLHYSQTSKKTSATEMKAYISEELMPVFEDMGVEYLVCADAEYFKVLTKTARVDPNLGYVLDCVFGAPGQLKVVYVPSFRQVFYDPERVTARISQGLTALIHHRAGTYQPPGEQIIQFEAYPQTVAEIADWLEQLLAMNRPLSIDIETFDLKPHRAGIGTISFAWSKHEGIAFSVDYENIPGASEAPYGRQVKNAAVRRLLRDFFERSQQKHTYHHIAFDVTVLIYQLYMKDITDTEGLLRGLSVMLRDWDCTKLVTYLATNSCAGNKLGLKDQAQAFAGNYAQEEIKDITRIRLDQLLRYNLVDCLSTWHVRDKHWDTMVADRQLDIYETLFKPTTRDIIQMQLTGLPVNMRKVKIAKYLLQRDERKALKAIQTSPIVQRFTYRLNEQWVEDRNAVLKKKRVTLADAKEVFNPNSGPQLQDLLYEMLGLPVIDFTDSRQPATGGKTLAKLLNHTESVEIITFLQAMIDYASVSKILTDFIPSLEDAIPGSDGWHYLCGNFNLGGTLSGRLSSSDPNLQNLPANSKYAKLIKWCIEAALGWILLGLDFASLEDRISALTTKDPNKLRVYTDGFDGHSLRAFTYWASQMPDIDPSSVESINSIEKKYKPWRQKSKAPTFALTYQGTWSTLVTNCGFSEAEARRIEAKYHELYRVSDEWVATQLDQASKDGFITAAFGLRVRTPLLAQVIRGNKKTPREAEAEGRSAGNALGQSWCLLNSRAWVEFMAKVRTSKHRLSIRPCAQIHDAGYALVRDDVATVAYVNKHLVEAVKWQDHPDIWHDQVKLGGDVSVFWPDWSQEIVIPNGATEHEIPGIIEKALEKRVKQ